VISVTTPQQVVDIGNDASIPLTDKAKEFEVQLGYLEVAVQEKLRSGWPGPFVKVEGCCD
jgi:hypothetical protein